MSHTTIYFLAKASKLDDAEGQVAEYLEGENFFDCYSMLPESSGLLAQKREELMAFIGNWDWKKVADGYMEQAGQRKAAGDLDMYGFYLIKAGEIYAQYLTVDTYAFNIDIGDYSIPSENEGWHVVAVNFHY